MGIERKFSISFLTRKQKFFLLGKANLALWASKDRITKSQGMSNLQLAEKVARVGAPESSKNPENSPQNQWAALHAALQSVEKIPKRQILVDLTGLEPVTSCLQSRRSTRWAKGPDYCKPPTRGEKIDSSKEFISPLMTSRALRINRVPMILISNLVPPYVPR